MNAISASGLTKMYGNKVALSNVNLEVKSGDFFCVVGLNGAGKSTLIKILSGQISPTSGSADVLGMSVNDRIELKKKIGVVPEVVSVPVYLTVREYLEFCSNLRGGDVDSAIKKFWLSEHEDELCMNLSKGMRQRLTLAAAFLHEPKLVFLDEPFINLDPLYQKHLIDILGDYINNGGTVFMSTHILEIASKLCKGCAIIHKGTVMKLLDAPGELEDVFLEVVDSP